MVNFQVAIDGPAGSGKSSISGLVAKELGFIHIDTGAMYRAVTLEALRREIDLEDESQYDFFDEITVCYIDNKIFLNDCNVSEEIRTDIVTKNVSTVSKFKIVRDRMVHFQRISASSGCVLMDGRDIGSTVLPNADVKIFLTASSEERAKRRMYELKSRNKEVKFEDVLKDLIERDYKDSHREISPLRMATDAVLIDTTTLSIEEVSNKIINIVYERLRK